MIHNLIIVLSTATVWTHFIVSTFIFWVAQSELVWNDPMIIIALNSSHTTAQTLTWTSLQDSAIMAAWTLLRAKPSISFFRQTGAWPTWIRRNQSYQEWQSLQKDKTHDPTLDVKDLLFFTLLPTLHTLVFKLICFLPERHESHLTATCKDLRLARNM